MLLSAFILSIFALIYTRRMHHLKEYYQIMHNVVIVTAYYEVKNKYDREKYISWIDNFFKAIGTTRCVCFCAPEIANMLKSKAAAANASNVIFVERPFNSYVSMSPQYMKSYKKAWDNDSSYRPNESPELHAIWTAKREFVDIAIKEVEPHGNIYVWCDIGCFRNERSGNFKATPKYIKPGKMTLLWVGNGHNAIGGGVLAGDKVAWEELNRLYAAELAREFKGIDQGVLTAIYNESNANIIHPTDELGDRWFYLTYIFNEQ